MDTSPRIQASVSETHKQSDSSTESAPSAIEYLEIDGFPDCTIFDPDPPARELRINPMIRPIPPAVDLPGAEGVNVGLELAAMGYRPVPLYNAAPGSFVVLESTQTTYTGPVVDVRPIMDALIRGTEFLASLKLSRHAPPVFLLDADRRFGTPSPGEGRFDNRSVSFATDFPSANFLLSQNIHRVMLVQHLHWVPQADLAHTLRRWHAAGIAIHLKRIDQDSPPIPCPVDKPSLWGETMFRLTVLLGLRRNPLGGYGGLVATASGG